MAVSVLGLLITSVSSAFTVMSRLILLGKLVN